MHYHVLLHYLKLQSGPHSLVQRNGFKNYKPKVGPRRFKKASTNACMAFVSAKRLTRAQPVQNPQGMALANKPDQRIVNTSSCCS
ncbi:hypothetical protein GW17_00028441 [Ensete ventricosum]|nr:hypothetical protein GW17_00028441 [Ensete ventricosum]